MVIRVYLLFTRVFTQRRIHIPVNTFSDNTVNEYLNFLLEVDQFQVDDGNYELSWIVKREPKTFVFNFSFSQKKKKKGKEFELKIWREEIQFRIIKLYFIFF